MSIDWASIGQVFGVCLVATVALVGLFTLGIVGTSRRPGAVQADGTVAGGASAAARSAGYAAFAVCTVAVGYGLYLIVAG